MFDVKQVDLPTEKNWYEDGVVSAPNNQALCGSCWAFTTIATLESLAVISGKYAEPVEFSVQQLVDCDQTNFGCDGGWMYKAYSYVSKYGVMEKSNYPYTGKVGECMYDGEKAVFKNVGMV